MQHLKKTAYVDSLSCNDGKEGFSISETPANSPDRVLLLTSKLGTGHHRAAESILLSLKAVDARLEVEILDFWSLMDDKVADKLKQGYLNIVTEHPDLYERVYRVDQTIWRQLLDNGTPPLSLLEAINILPPELIPRTWRWLAPGSGTVDRALLLSLYASLKNNYWPGIDKLALRGALHLGWERLLKQLLQRLETFRPDVCISTQMLPAALLSTLRYRSLIKVPTIGVPTDFGVHDFWIQPGTDHYCVATGDMASVLLSHGIENDQIHITGIPLSPEFQQLTPVKEARNRTGLRDDRPVILVMGGGLGLGLIETVEILLGSQLDMQLVVVTGENQAALAELKNRYPAEKRLHIYGWTDQMATLICAADVLLGKPGGITTAEAIACGRPLFATRSLRGQESFNVAFLEKHQVGGLIQEHDLVSKLGSLLSDPAELKHYQQRAWKLGQRDSSRKIVELVYQISNYKQTHALS